MAEAEEQLQLAKSHLQRVRAAWDSPTDWSDLCLYGFYCLECAVAAAGEHLGLTFRRSHPDKARVAQELAANQGLPDVSDLLRELNDARKSVSYGDIDMPELDAEDVANAIEEFVEQVESLLGA